MWRAVRWTAVIIGASVFACGAVNRLTSGRSPPEPGSFDRVVAQVSTDGFSDAGPAVGDAAAARSGDGSGSGSDAGPGDGSGSGSDAGPGDGSGSGGDARPGHARGLARTVCAERRRRGLVGQLNLNTASIAELVRLPGIGEAKARRIVAFRSRRGPFRKVRDLRRVRGFGRKTVSKLAPHLAIAGATTLRTE